MKETRITVRMTNEELETFKQLAQARGMKKERLASEVIRAYIRPYKQVRDNALQSVLEVYKEARPNKKAIVKSMTERPM